MSGVAGGTRIQKQDVQNTFNKYVKEILEQIPGFIKASLSGSVKAGTKPDYGDLDLITLFEGEDKREVKKDIIEVVTNQPDSIIIPFQSEKHKGKKYYNSGEIITVLYPIDGQQDKYIQVDNIIALTEQEHTFKNNFLDIPAEKQGLILGLVKVILLEEPKEQVFARLGIKIDTNIGENQEFEFNLSSNKLTLRKVTLDGFKQLAREEIWDTTDWSTIENLFKNYDLNKSFEHLLNQISKKLTNPRSKRRIKGIFNSMVSVKSGEVGTEKGLNKEKAIEKVNSLLENTDKQVVALYAGGFKPPHIAHFENAKNLSQDVDKLIIFIGPKIREGIKITAEQSKDIWEVYSKYLPVQTETIISKVTPVRDIYDWIDNNQPTVGKIITGAMSTERGKFAYLTKNKDKYPKVEIRDLPILSVKEDSKFSATTLRQSVEFLKKGEWIPKEIKGEDRIKVQQIATKNVPSEGEIQLQETLEKTLSEWIEGKRLKTKPNNTKIQERVDLKSKELNSRERNDLSNLYFRLVNTVSTELFTIDYNDNRIVIQPKLKTESKFKYTDYIASILEYMVNKGENIHPLPEVKIRQDVSEASNIFGKTAYYDTIKKEIVLYTHSRHPKDILRSFTHEMIHHIQNLEGRIGKVHTENINKDEYLLELEKEAYLRGNLTLRGWEDNIKNS